MCCSARGQRDAPSSVFVFSANRRFETAAARFDYCLSQEILDGVNGWLTT